MCLLSGGYFTAVDHSFQQTGAFEVNVNSTCLWDSLDYFYAFEVNVNRTCLWDSLDYFFHFFKKLLFSLVFFVFEVG